MTDRARKRQDAWRKTNKLNVTFNTHEATKALKSSGFNEKQAESVVETIDKAVNETVATKADLEVMASKMATKEELRALRKTVKTEIANLETRMMRMMLLQTLVLVGTLGTLIFAVVELL